MGISLTLEIQFYSHLLEFYTTLVVACTGAKWQQYNQVTVRIAYCELVRLTQLAPPRHLKTKTYSSLSPIDYVTTCYLYRMKLESQVYIFE
jgi:hypothetical protein